MEYGICTNWYSGVYWFLSMWTNLPCIYKLIYANKLIETGTAIELWCLIKWWIKTLDFVGGRWTNSERNKKYREQLWHTIYTKRSNTYAHNGWHAKLNCTNTHTHTHIHYHKLNFDCILFDQTSMHPTRLV